MNVNLNNIPTTNSLGEINLRITFVLKKKDQATLNVGEALPLKITFDSIAIGASELKSIYRNESPIEISVEPGNVAFIERINDSRIALRYASPNSTQQSIFFAR
ncbi:hypothetical protein D3C76_917550 [compost metagenome]